MLGSSLRELVPISVNKKPKVAASISKLSSMDPKSQSKRALSGAQIADEQRAVEEKCLSYIDETKKFATSAVGGSTRAQSSLQLNTMETGSIESFHSKPQRVPTAPEYRRTNSTSLNQHPETSPQRSSETRHTRAIGQLQQVDQNAENEMYELRKANQILKERLTASERDRDSWRKKARETADELADCRDELFTLHPRDAITDTQVGEDWDRLCQQIAQWVDDEMEIKDDPSNQLGLLPNNSLVRGYWGEDRQRLIERYSMKDDFDWLLRYNIHCLLEKDIFSESIYLFGLPESDARVLARVEKALGKLEPRRGMLYGRGY